MFFKFITGVNPEHMLVPRGYPYRSAPAARTIVPEDITTHKYVTSPIATTKIISPDDENVKLTETMKKSCKGKTIFYNSNPYVDSYRSMVKGGVIGDDRDDMIQHFKRTTPQLSNDTLRMGERGLCSDIKVTRQSILCLSIMLYAARELREICKSRKIKIESSGQTSTQQANNTVSPFLSSEPKINLKKACI